LQVQKVKSGHKQVKWHYQKTIQIPEKWVVKKLEDVVTVLDSKRVPLKESTREIRHGKHPYYGASGIIDYVDDYIFDEKLLCLSEDGENLRSRVSPIAFTIEGKTWVNNHAHVLRVKTNMSHVFLKYSLNRLSLLRYVASSAQPKLNQKDMCSITVICPTLSEQEKISSILSNVDNLISSYDDVIQSTKKLKIGLMQKLLTKGIGHKKFKKVKWLFGKEIKIPDNWKIVRLEETSKIVDSLHVTPSYSPKGFPMIRSTEIKSGDLKLDGAFRVSKKIYDQFTNNYSPQKNDIVMSRVGTYFVTSFVNTDERFCMGQNTLVIHPKINSHFLYIFLNSIFLNKQLEFLFDRTSGQKTMSLANIKKLRIFCPTLSEQEKISSILQLTHSRIEEFESKKSHLESLKKGLMQKLLTGQIRVK